MSFRLINIDRTSVKLMSHLQKLKNDKVNKVEKWQLFTAGLNLNHMHIFKPWQKDVQSFIKIGMKLYKKRSCTHKVPTIWGQKMTKFTKWKKWQKLIQGSYPNTMHISRPWRKQVQSFKKIGIKLFEELRLQCTHCLYTFIESEVRNWQSSQSGESDKN